MPLFAVLFQTFESSVRANTNSKPTQVRFPRRRSRASKTRHRYLYFVLCVATMADRLSVNKASSKKSKKPNAAAARPLPKVYNIHPAGFRLLVQELTGNSYEPATQLPPKPPNSRLQKFAPPPLGPPEIIPASERLKLDPIAVSPVPILFSPMTAFAPLDWTWADDTSASPTSLAYRQLAESLVEQAERRSEEDTDQDLILPLSPTFAWQSKNIKPQTPRDSNLRSPGAQPPAGVYYLQRSPSPRCGSLSPTTLSLFGMGSPGSFAGFDIGTI